MALRDLFGPVPTLSAEEVRGLAEERDPGEVQLVDVRQPAEYAAGHLPGARLIPLAQLASRLGELDPAKPTVAY